MKRLTMCLAVLGLAGAGHADQLFYYLDIFGNSGYSTTSINATSATLANAGAGKTVDIPQFQQTVIGQTITELTSVELSVNWAADGMVSVLNQSGTPSGGIAFTNATSSVPLTVSGPSGITINTTAVAGPVSGTALAAQDTQTPATDTYYLGPVNNSDPNSDYYYFPDTSAYAYCTDATTNGIANGLGAGTFTPDPSNPGAGSCTFPTGGYNTVITPTTTSFDSGLFTGGPIGNTGTPNLSAFEGRNFALLPFTVSTDNAKFAGTEMGGNGMLFFGGTGQVGGILKVEYDYQTVSIPEPVPSLLIGASLLGLGAALRRRQWLAMNRRPL